MTLVPSSGVEIPLRVLGVWHVACAVAGFTSVVPVLPAALTDFVGWITLALLVLTAAIGTALFVGKRGVLGLAAGLQGAQVLAITLPGIAAWIVRLGIRVSVSIPSIEGRGVFVISNDATVFAIWGASARIPLGVSVNLCALMAFVLCLSCLPGRARQLRVVSA